MDSVIGVRRFKDIDADADGIVDRQEYMLDLRDRLDAAGLTDKASRKATYKFAEALYEMCDVDGDGVLNEAEIRFRDYLVAEEEHERQVRGKEEFGSLDRLRSNLEKAAVSLQQLDTSGDGEVDAVEFRPVWQSRFLRYGFDKSMTEDPDVIATMEEVIFSEADITGNGGLGPREMRFAEFLVPNYVIQEMASQLFEDFDSNGDNRIDLAEVEAGVAAFPPESTPGLMAHLMKDGLRLVDANADGQLEFKEAINLVSIAMFS